MDCDWLSLLTAAIGHTLGNVHGALFQLVCSQQQQGQFGTLQDFQLEFLSETW